MLSQFFNHKKHPGGKIPDKKIKVVALDLDGTIFDSFYHEQKYIKPLEEIKKDFIEYLASQIIAEGVDEVIVISASLRQDKSTDDYNSGENYSRTESGFTAIPKIYNQVQKRVNEKLQELNIPKRISFRFDNFLLSDKQEEGENFEHATHVIQQDINLRLRAINFEKKINCLTQNYMIEEVRSAPRKKVDIGFNFPTAQRDDSKFLLTFTHMLKISQQNPQAHITYDLYEDLPQVIGSLKDSYEKNEILPERLKFRSFLCKDKSITLQSEVLGTKQIGGNYRENIHYLLTLIGCSNPRCNQNIAELLIYDPFKNKLKEFTDYCEINFYLEKLSNKIKRLSENQSAKKEELLTPFISIMKELYSDLERNIQAQKKQGCHAEDILKSHAIRMTRAAINMLRELDNPAPQGISPRKYLEKVMDDFAYECKDAPEDLSICWKVIPPILIAALGAATAPSMGLNPFYGALGWGGLALLSVFSKDKLHIDAEEIKQSAQGLNRLVR